ncbi:MAG: hypothetical protein GY757_32245, partial [bacterium]|nr:hypothetical protein [bacterium]
MLVNAPNMEDLRKMTDSINAVPGVESASLLEVANPMLDETTLSAIEAAEAAFDEDPKARDMSRRASSYLLLDVEREKLNDIYPTLKLDEKVIYCDYTTGTHNMVLFISGNYYDQIDSFIKDKIINMDGVLKAKEYPIVSFTEM